MAKFDATDTQVFGISMDSFVANKKFAEEIKVTVPILSDWKRETTKAYGLYDEKSGYGRRGTFVIDKEGIIQHVEVGNTAIDPTGAYQVCDLLKVKQAAKPTQMTAYAPCPKCRSAGAERMKFTWWGGVIGPKVLTHVKCPGCGHGYNGKTGRDNTTGIVIYSVIVGIVALGLAVVAVAAAIMLIAVSR